MQVLLLQLGSQHYALDTRHVVRVLPAMRLVALPRTPAFIAGIMNYHGAPVPVLDLTLIGAVAGIETDLPDPPASSTLSTMSASITSANPAAPAGETWFDTRIVLVSHLQPDGGTRLLGLRAEHVTGTRSIDPAQIVDSGVQDRGSLFLGKLIAGVTPMLQLIELAQLLPPHVTRWLAGRMAEAPC